MASLACDCFKLTGAEGPGTGQSLTQFPVRTGDHVLADRGYSTATGIRHVAAAGGRLIVRLDTGAEAEALPLRTPDGTTFDRLANPADGHMDNVHRLRGRADRVNRGAWGRFKVTHIR